MKQPSYSQRCKSNLRVIDVKKKCCRRVVEDLADMQDTDGSSGQLLDSYRALKCPNCHAVFIRWLFIRFGSITSPEKGYHLEFSFYSPKLADQADLCLAQEGIPPRKTVRKGKTILYYKDSSQIEDILAIIGATGAAFDFMNQKIMKEMRNTINRQVNCDTRNIQASLSAAKEQTEMLRWLRTNGLLDRLPPDCRITAELRLAHPQMNLSELGMLHEPHISKSGVSHRLKKISEIVNSLNSNEQKS